MRVTRARPMRSPPPMDIYNTRVHAGVNRNVIYPLYNPARVANKEFSTGVEIVEIKSEDDNQNDPNNSYDKIPPESDHYQECQDDELNRECNFNKANNCSFELTDSMIDYEAIRSIYSEFYDSECFDKKENMTSNHYENLFTIVENEKCSRCSSSEDDRYDNLGFNKHTTRDRDYNSSYEDDIFAYNDDRTDTAERNVLIYSFKNTCYFTETGLENNDRNTLPNYEDQNVTGCSDRIPTPVPAYIPRFHLPLNPTLSTVTEISEPNRSNSINTTQYAESADAIQKSKNSWLKDINMNYEILPRPKSAGNPCNGTNKPLTERIKCAKVKELNFQVNKNLKPLPQPQVILNSIDSNSNPMQHKPDITICIDLKQNDFSESKIGDGEKHFIHQLIIAQLIERIGNVQSMVNDNLSKLRQPQIKLTANVDSDSNIITLLIEKIENVTMDRGTKDEIIEVFDLDLVSIPQKCSQSNNTENINLEILDTEYSNDIPRDSTSVKIRTDVHLKKRTWFRKMVRCFQCCK